VPIAPSCCAFVAAGLSRHLRVLLPSHHCRVPHPQFLEGAGLDSTSPCRRRLTAGSRNSRSPVKWWHGTTVPALPAPDETSYSVLSATSVVNLSYSQIPPPTRTIIRTSLAQPSAPSARYEQFECYLLTTSSRHGNVPPVTANDKTKNCHQVITGLRVSATFSQNGTPVSPPYHPTRKTVSANSPGITFLHSVYLQLPWNHILTQNTPGGGPQAPKIFRHRAANVIEPASIVRIRLGNTELGTRTTEHAS
jgi:hypothetical protein